MYFKFNTSSVVCCGGVLIHIAKPEYFILGKLKSGKVKETDGTRDTENTDDTSDADDTDDTDDSSREYTKNEKTKEEGTQKKKKTTKCVKGKRSENYEAK